MPHPSNIDGVLITWGDRLFYPSNRMVKGKPTPRLNGMAAKTRASTIRKRIEATVLRRAPQVMVKVTGGGRDMKAIAAHFRYISKNGRLDIEDERGESMRGKDSLYDLADDWRLGGSLIPDETEPAYRREAFNIMLSMPRGTDPMSVLWAAREFAKTELVDHKYVMVLHDHQANPARPHLRSSGVQARPAPQPAQDRPAPLARDLCRQAARPGHRGRGDAPGHAGHDTSLPGAVAGEGGRRRPAHEGAGDRGAGRSRAGIARRGPDRLARDRHRAWRLGQRGRPATCALDTGLRGRRGPATCAQDGPHSGAGPSACARRPGAVANLTGWMYSIRSNRCSGHNRAA